MFTVRQLREYLDGLPDEIPVVIDVNAGYWYLRVENVRVTSDQDATGVGDPNEDIEVVLFWEPEEPGWFLIEGEDVPEDRAGWPFRTIQHD